MRKNCLIISYGPVPTPKYQKIEGGGQRCWGLALGLISKGYDVTIAINSSFPLDVKQSSGVKLINWSEDQRFIDTFNGFETVIMNYAMGGPMSFVVDNISDNVRLVLDCYVPIYIEVSARDSDDQAAEYSSYSHNITHYNKALLRGDYFLCANIPQKHMYMGVLSALGIINPYSYKKERVLVVPFGVESSIKVEHPRNPYTELGIKKDDFVLLWFGGLYPWFKIDNLLDVVRKISLVTPKFKFVIVGGKNPYNTNPDFTKQYDQTLRYATEQGMIGKSVMFVDWVDFSDRINWYKYASSVVSINNVGEENIYSWRTRVMDYVWGEIPMITNGGDPLSDSLIANRSAVLLPDTTPSTLYSVISSLIDNPGSLKDIKRNLISQKKNYLWEKVVQPIDTKLSEGFSPYLDEKLFIQDFKPDTIKQIRATGVSAKLNKISKLPRKLIRLAKEKGVRRSIKIVSETIVNRTRKATVSSRKQYYFLSHPVDHTGAPLVLLDIINDYVDRVSPNEINLVYPGGEKELLRGVRKLGVRMDKMVMGVGSRLIHGQLGIKKDDFVLINTVAVYPNYRDYIFGLLDSGRLNKATWFIHEDKPEAWFRDGGLVARIKNLLLEGKIEILVPSEQTAKDYRAFFDTKSVRVVTLRVSTPEIYQKPRKADDFNKIRFVISGTPSDGRKGQLLAIAAFSKFINDCSKKSPAKYRDFELHLIAIGETGDDYISTQIRAIGDGLLKDKVFYYPKIAKERAMEITAGCNATICCSLNETFALFVAEGMQMGHVLLRNKTSGYREQLKDGVNGFNIDELNIDDFTKKIERLLNKSTGNETLVEMGNQSTALAKPYKTANYFKQINA